MSTAEAIKEVIPSSEQPGRAQPLSAAPPSMPTAKRQLSLPVAMRQVSEEGEWLFSCKPGTSKKELLDIFGVIEGEDCTVIELKGIDWSNGVPAQLIDFFLSWLGERQESREGGDWERLRLLLHKVFNVNVILFVHDVAVP